MAKNIKGYKQNRLDSKAKRQKNGH